MGFTAPIWLIGLIPWGALAVWLLSGHRERAVVPFLQLWPTDVPRPREKRAIRRPPLSLILLLAAMLLAIVGAAGPFLHREGVGSFVMIVDRDVSMSARFRDSDRLSAVLEIAREQLRLDGQTDWIAVPSGPTARASSLRTLPALRETVRQELADSSKPVVVLSDQSLGIDDRRIVQISLPQPIENVGIVRLGARENPSVQFMVRLRNQSNLNQAELIVSSDGETVRKTIELPPRGDERDCFIDLPAAGRVVSVQLQVDDELPADNHAWLVRSAVHPSIEQRGVLPQEIARMIDVYGKLRPSGEGSLRVAVIDSLDGASGSGPCAIVAREPADAVPTDEAVRFESHAVTTDVDWSAIVSDARVGAAPTGHWQALVRVADRTLVAAREQPVRQVWVGFDAQSWARSSDFVIFWTNVFDWLGAGGEQFTAEPIQQLSDEWVRSDDLSGGIPLPLDPSPGVYRRSDGALRALNVADVELNPATQTDWEQRLKRLPRGLPGAGSVGAATLFTALGCALLSALSWGSAARRIAST